MELDFRQHRPSWEMVQLAPRSMEAVRVLAAVLLAVVSLGGVSLADGGWRKGLHLTLFLTAVVLLARSGVRLRKSRELAGVAPLRRGVVATWAAGGAALGIAAWLFFVWPLPVGLGVVAVTTGCVAMQGCIREEASRNSGLRDHSGGHTASSV